MNRGDLGLELEAFTRSARFGGIIRDQWNRFHPEVVTALPVNPPDGHEVYFLADAADGVMWHLRFRRGGTPPHRWDRIGGSPLMKAATTTVTVTANYPSYNTVISPLTVPLSGVYLVTFDGRAYYDGSGGTGFQCYWWINGVDDSNCSHFYSAGGASVRGDLRGAERKTLGAGATVGIVASRSAAGGGTAQVTMGVGGQGQNQPGLLSILPIKVG